MEGPELIHVLMNPILAMLMGGLLLFIWLFSRQQAATKYFGIAYIAYAICNFQLILLIPSNIDLNLFSTGIFHGFFATFFYGGVVALAYKKPNWRLALALSVVFIVLRYYVGTLLEDRALRVYLVFGFYTTLLSIAAWHARELRHESPFSAALFYLVIGFVIVAIPHTYLTDFTQNTKYGYTPTEHWYTKQFLFNIFFIVFYTVLMAILAARGIRNAKLEGATDPLTELLNRRGFEDATEKLLPEVENFCLISLDLDKFKGINDTYGHHVGDNVLRMVATRIQDNIRETDIASRIGGEEFLIFLPKTTIAEASAIAERLRQAISSTPVTVRGTDVRLVRVTSSFGVCQFYNHDGENSLSQAYRFVDGLLYEAKKNGRNQVVAKAG